VCAVAVTRLRRDGRVRAIGKRQHRAIPDGDLAVATRRRRRVTSYAAATRWARVPSSCAWQAGGEERQALLALLAHVVGHSSMRRRRTDLPRSLCVSRSCLAAPETKARSSRSAMGYWLARRPSTSMNVLQCGAVSRMLRTSRRVGSIPDATSRSKSTPRPPCAHRSHHARNTSRVQPARLVVVCQ